MENPKQLASRFREVMLDGKWVANTNYKDLLSKVNWQTATHKIENLNTIADLAQHINYYIQGVLNVFNGGDLEIRDKYSFNFPRVKTEEQWQNIQEVLFNNAKSFADHIELMDNEKLDSYFVDKKYGSYKRNIEGMIEHCYYHLGQISLISKLIRQNNLKT